MDASASFNFRYNSSRKSWTNSGPGHRVDRAADRRGCPASLGALPLQLHADPVVVGELDAGGLEGVAEECESAGMWRRDLGLELSDGAEADLGTVGQVFLGPSEKAARSTALSRGDHGAI